MISISDTRNSVFQQTRNGSNKVGAETIGRWLKYISMYWQLNLRNWRKFLRQCEKKRMTTEPWGHHRFKNMNKRSRKAWGCYQESQRKIIFQGKNRQNFWEVSICLSEKYIFVVEDLNTIDWVSSLLLL